MTCGDGFGFAVFRYRAAADPLEPLEDHAAGISNMVNCSTPISAESQQKRSQSAGGIRVIERLAQCQSHSKFDEKFGLTKSGLTHCTAV
ncbi:MAG: hypothetical protein WA718_00445 [Terriglobales bacterium]